MLFIFPLENLDKFQLDRKMPVVLYDFKVAKNISMIKAPAKATRNSGTKYFLNQQANEEEPQDIDEVGTMDKTSDNFP
eukprot:snap_masked-scaffold_21-processed-gene-2.14-mRNA-1 protein AED:1.00 eAED:1.00 QI:0/0/0/0/1/1/2/0/77